MLPGRRPSASSLQLSDDLFRFIGVKTETAPEISLGRQPGVGPGFLQAGLCWKCPLLPSLMWKLGTIDPWLLQYAAGTHPNPALLWN